MKTLLTAWQQAQGVALVNDRGIELPERFSNPLEEYRAVREKVGLINLSFRSQIRMTGEDRVSFLQGMVSNDVKALRPGEGCAATLLTEQGRIVADLRVYISDTCLLLDVDARSKEKLIDTLSRFIVADDVEMEDLSETQMTLALQGPLSSQVLAATGIAASPSKMFQHCETTLAGTSVRLIRANDTGEDGYEILVPSVQAEAVWQTLLKAGVPLGLRPVGLAALNTLRIE